MQGRLAKLAIPTVALLSVFVVSQNSKAQVPQPAPSTIEKAAGQESILYAALAASAEPDQYPTHSNVVSAPTSPSTAAYAAARYPNPYPSTEYSNTTGYATPIVSATPAAAAGSIKPSNDQDSAGPIAEKSPAVQNADAEYTLRLTHRGYREVVVAGGAPPIMKELDYVEILVQPDHRFAIAARSGNRTCKYRGTLRRQQNGNAFVLEVSIDCSETVPRKDSPPERHGIATDTSIELSVDKPQVIRGMFSLDPRIEGPVVESDEEWTCELAAAPALVRASHH